MRKFLSFMAIAGGLAAVPALAQEEAPAETVVPAPAEMSPEQMLAFDTWPEERKALFQGWPAEAQTYFWALTPPRQEVFWMLSDADRLTLLGMTEEARETAWAGLEEQMLASQPPVGAEPPPSAGDLPMPDPGTSAPMPAPEPESMADDTVQDHGPR